MPLNLTLTQTRGGGDRQTRALARGTLSIGRAAGNDWVLPDPDQHLSRTHCMISFEGGRYVLTDLSTNGMLINGARQPTARNSRIILTDGDFFQLGGYTITVADLDDPATAPGGAAQGGMIQGGGPGDAGPLDVDPLADPLGYAGDQGYAHPLPHSPPSLRKEDPFDRVEQQHARPTSLDGDDLFRGTTVPDSESWKGATPSDRADGVAFAFTAPKIVAQPVNPGEFDFDALIGDDLPIPAGDPLDPGRPAVPGPAAHGFPGGHGSPGQAAALANGAALAAASGPAQAAAFDDLIGDLSPAPPGTAFSPVPAGIPGGVQGGVPGGAVPPRPAPAVPDLTDFDDLIGDLAGAPITVPPVAPPPVAPPPVVPPPVLPPRLDAGTPASPFDDLAGDSFVSPRPTPTPPAVTPAVVAVPPVAPVASAPPATPAVQMTPVQTTPAAAAAQTGLLAAFLDGAGMPQLSLAGDPEATMRAIGALFRAFVAGTRDVLMSRAEIKHQLRVEEQTMLRARDNNALKFSVSAEEALVALLQPDRPGYKAPLAAVAEAFTDVRSHEMAVMAGLQTALIALLKRFDPATLESRLKAGMLDSIMPGARKARFWELFCATYKDLAREAEDDFHSVFGREFARAYDAQVRKL